MTKYFESGETKSETAYKNGQRDGEWKVYNRKGAIVSNMSYKDGVDVAAAAATKAEEEKKAAAAKKKEAAKNPAPAPAPGQAPAPIPTPNLAPGTSATPAPPDNPK